MSSNEINSFSEEIMSDQHSEYVNLLHKDLASLNASVSELKGSAELMESEIARLNECVRDREAQIHSLVDMVNNKEIALQTFNRIKLQDDFRYKLIKSSVAWHFSKPIRLLTDNFNGLYGGDISLLPLQQLSKEGSEWQSHGDDPQFLLVLDQPWHKYAGWSEIELKITINQPLNIQIYFDIGHGFTPSLVINFTIEQSGIHRIAVFIPHRCKAIRFDPCDLLTSFKLSSIVLKKLAAAPVLSGVLLLQSRTYEALGAVQQGNMSIIDTAGCLSFDAEGEHSWVSDDIDPWFLIANNDQVMGPGWYMIEVCIEADISQGKAKFYFDYSGGFSESYSTEFTFVSGKECKRIFEFTDVPRQIRFDPLECAAKFSVKHLNFVRLNSLFAYHRMLLRLKAQSLAYEGKPLMTIIQQLGAEAKKEQFTRLEMLKKAYSRTFIGSAQNNGLAYSEWIRRIEKPEFDNLDKIRKTQEKFTYKPLVSVIVPVYNTPEEFLRKTIDSVINQSYPNWELCIADDKSPKPHVRQVLEEYIQQDARIKVEFRQQNGHISAASNSALTLATGDFIALLDHDDELSPHALHYMVEAINENPSAMVIYSDEDKIDEQGKRAEPHFKSDWNPDMFFSTNYVSHLGVYRRDLITQIGGFRIGVEGSQDQDLLLRCLPHIKGNEIVHVPRVLYHWRIMEGSTALDSGEKSYTTDAGIKSLQDYFKSIGKDDITVTMGPAANTYRVIYGIPKPDPLVSMIIPTRDMLSVLEPCIRSILDKTSYQNYEIIILDNGSVEPETIEYFQTIQEEDKRIRVIPYDFPFNYSSINNYGVQFANGEVIGLVNNDVEIINHDWLTEMVSHAMRPEIGCVGAKLYYDDDTVQHGGVILGLGGVASHSHKNFQRDAPGYFYRLKLIQNLSAVTAACLLIRKSVYNEVGGLEEDLKVAFNDVDFCIKVREAGYRNLWTPYAELYHYESKSRGLEDTPEKIQRFVKEIEYVRNKWGVKLQKDPYYNKNLTLNAEDFSL
ncbi:hypothetical protein JCM14076_31330 [Methylosoma difficile]